MVAAEAPGDAAAVPEDSRGAEPPARATGRACRHCGHSRGAAAACRSSPGSPQPHPVRHGWAVFLIPLWQREPSLPRSQAVWPQASLSPCLGLGFLIGSRLLLREISKGQAHGQCWDVNGSICSAPAPSSLPHPDSATPASPRMPHRLPSSALHPGPLVCFPACSASAC